MLQRYAFLGSFVCLMLSLYLTSAQPTYFRSDHGHASSTRPLPDFQSTNTLRWRVPLDAGQSTPLLCQDRLVLTTCRTAEPELATVALSPRDGTVLWKRALPVERLEAYHPATGSAAAPTPAFDGVRLYVFFGSYGLVCYDLDGRKVWEYRMGPFQDEYGAGSSPILVDDKVVLCQDHDRDSFLLALDRQTGRVCWKVARPDAVRSYSTPAIWTQNGRPELLVAGALELAGYDPDTGERSWWVQGLARIVIPVPLPSGNTVYMASWSPGGDTGRRLALDPWPQAISKWDRNQDGKLARAEVNDAEVLDRFFRMDLDQSEDLIASEWERHASVFRKAQNGAMAIQPSGRGDLSDRAVKWRYARGAPYVASPLLSAHGFWMVKDGGIVTRLEPTTGRLISEERLPGMGGYFASPVAGDGKVYFASQLGVVSVVADNAEWRVLSSHNFREKIYATPLLAEGRVFIRTEEALYCFEKAR